MARIPIYQQDQLASSVVGTAGVDNSALAAAGSLAQGSAALESAQQQANIAQGSAFVQGISSALQNVGQELSALQAARAAADAKKAAIREQAVLASKLARFKSTDEDVLKEIQNANINTPMQAKTLYRETKSLDGFIAGDVELSANKVLQDKFRAHAEPITGENEKRLIDWGDKQDDVNQVNELELYRKEAPTRIAKADNEEQFNRNLKIEFDAIDAKSNYIPKSKLDLVKSEVEEKAAGQYGYDVASKFNPPTTVDGKLLNHDQWIEKYIKTSPIFNKVSQETKNSIVAHAEEVRKDKEEQVNREQAQVRAAADGQMQNILAAVDDDDRRSMVVAKDELVKFRTKLQESDNPDHEVLGQLNSRIKSVDSRIRGFDTRARTAAGLLRAENERTAAAVKQAAAETYAAGAPARAAINAKFGELVSGTKDGKKVYAGTAAEVDKALDIARDVRKAFDAGYLNKTDIEQYNGALLDKLAGNIKAKESGLKTGREKNAQELFWEHNILRRTPKSVSDLFNHKRDPLVSDRLDQAFVQERNALLAKYFRVPMQLPTQEQMARIDAAATGKLVDRLLQGQIVLEKDIRNAAN